MSRLLQERSRVDTSLEVPTLAVDSLSFDVQPGTVVLETGAGGSWVLDLETPAVTVLLGDEHGNAKPTATVTADPSDMVLAFYRRELIGELRVEGATELVPQLLNWPNLD